MTEIKKRRRRQVRVCECDYCFYCDMPVFRHEHDHFPEPFVRGGEDVVPACMNCHEVKDRTLLADWPLDFAFAGFAEMIDSLGVVASEDANARSLQGAELQEWIMGSDYRKHWDDWSVKARLAYAKIRAIGPHEKPGPAANGE